MNVEKELNEKPNSCEISINAKGQYSGKIKVYAETIEEANKLAFDKALERKKLGDKKWDTKKITKKTLCVVLMEMLYQ